MVTESSTSNIAVYDPQPSLPDWVTPVYTLRAPFLRGTMRSELMDRGLLREEVITVGRLRRWVEEGREVVGMNGLRWVLSASCCCCAKLAPAKNDARSPQRHLEDEDRARVIHQRTMIICRVVFRYRLWYNPSKMMSHAVHARTRKWEAEKRVSSTHTRTGRRRRRRRGTRQEECGM